MRSAKPNSSDAVQYELLKLMCNQEATIIDLTLSVAVLNAALHEILGESFAGTVAKILPSLKESEAHRGALAHQKELNEFLEKVKQQLGLQARKRHMKLS